MNMNASLDSCKKALLTGFNRLVFDMTYSPVWLKRKFSLSRYLLLNNQQIWTW